MKFKKQQQYNIPFKVYTFLTTIEQQIFIILMNVLGGIFNFDFKISLMLVSEIIWWRIF